MLMGVRTGELRLATPNQFDLEQGLWVIPPEVVKQLQLDMRKKGKRSQDIPPYIVPLSPQAIEIVQYLLKQVKPAQRYLFAHRSGLTKRISENTLNGALKRMGYQDPLTGHGIRGTISTALNEFGYLEKRVDAQLSHSGPDKVSTAYNHAEYVEPRRRMMQDWANRLDLLEQGHVKAASTHLTICIEGVPAMVNNENASARKCWPSMKRQTTFQFRSSPNWLARGCRNNLSINSWAFVVWTDFEKPRMLMLNPTGPSVIFVNQVLQ